MARRRTPTEERFWPKVDRDGPIPPNRPDLGPCWVWTAAVNATGYGVVSIGNHRARLAHRFAYQSVVGPIPEGLELDHLCRNRQCVNADHLEPVTRKINNGRGFSPTAENERKTHCPRGHGYTPENTYRKPNGWRECRECYRANSRRRYHQKRNPHAVALASQRVAEAHAEATR